MISVVNSLIIWHFPYHFGKIIFDYSFGVNHYEENTN